MLKFLSSTKLTLALFFIFLIQCSSKENEKFFLFTDVAVNIARQNIEQHEWAKVVFDSLRKVADDAVSIKAGEIPYWIPEFTPTRVVDCPVCGTYWAEYIWQWQRENPDEILCRVCSTRVNPENYPDNDSVLVYDPQGKPHALPVHRSDDGKIYHFRERVAYHKINQVRDWLEALGCVYAISKEEMYAETAIRLLTRLAAVYPGYALHDWERYGTKPWRMAGKISGWNYEDATLIIACGKAYDAIRNSSTWDEAKQELVKDGLFRCAADFLTAIRPDKQIINDTPFRYAGVAIAGRILQDAKVMRWVLDEELGIIPFILRYWNYDGSWVERAPSYHKMSLRKFHEVVDALEDYSDPPGYNNPDRFDHFSLKKMKRLQRIYESLFDITYPNGGLPPINDSHVEDEPMPILAEAAYGWFGSEKALVHLASAYGDSTLKNGDLYSLFHRPPNAPDHLNRIKDKNLDSRSTINVEDIGLAILRSQAKKNETMLTLQYGGIYGGHDHADKLDLTLFAEGREMLSDLGYVYSSFPNIFTWMQRSLAHNTVTVDGINQRYMHGDCVLFQSKPGFQVVETKNPWLYHKVTDVFNRQVIHVERDGRDYIVDIFRISGGKMHDWSVHAETSDLNVEGVVPIKIDKIDGRDYAYEHLTNIRMARFDHKFQVTWNWKDEPNAHLKLRMISPAKGQVFIADAPAQRRIGQEGRTLPYLIVRTRKTQKSTYIAVWEPFQDGSAIESVQLTTMKENSKHKWPCLIQIDWKDGVIDFVASDLTDQPGENFIFNNIDFQWKGRIGLIRFRENKIQHQKWAKAFSFN